LEEEERKRLENEKRLREEERKREELKRREEERKKQDDEKRKREELKRREEERKKQDDEKRKREELKRHEDEEQMLREEKRKQEELKRQKAEQMLREELKKHEAEEQKKKRKPKKPIHPVKSPKTFRQKTLKNLIGIWYGISLVLWAFLILVFASETLLKDLQDTLLTLIIIFTIIPIIILILVKFIFAPAPAEKPFEIKKIICTAFQILLIIFLLILLIQQFDPLLIDMNISVNYFLIIILILGVATILTKKEEDEEIYNELEEPTTTYYLFVIFMGISGAFLIWYKLKTMNIGYVTYLISGLGGILIIFLSISTWEEGAMKKVKREEIREETEAVKHAEQVKTEEPEEKEKEPDAKNKKETMISAGKPPKIIKILNKLPITTLTEIADQSYIELTPGMNKKDIVDAIRKSDKLPIGIILNILKKQKETSRIKWVREGLMKMDKNR